MNTKIEIYVDQNAAIRMGRKQYGTVMIDIDPADLTPEQRETLVNCETTYTGGERIPKPQYGGKYNLPPVGEATIETVKILLDALAAEKIRVGREEAAKRERQITHAVGLSVDDYCYNYYPSRIDYRWGVADYISVGEGDRIELSKISNDPRIAARIAEAKQEIARRNAELDIKEAEHKKQKAERETKEAAEKKEQERLSAEKAARQETQIAAWIAENGSDNQKKRAALNLLPRDEVLNDMRDEAFAPLDGYDRYEKITKSDIVCTCDEGYGDPVYKYRAGDETEATAEDFDRMEQIQNFMPGAVVTLRWHQGWCETCYDRAEEEDQDDMIFTRHSIRVAVTVGDFEFTREYAC